MGQLSGRFAGGGGAGSVQKNIVNASARKCSLIEFYIVIITPIVPHFYIVNSNCVSLKMLETNFLHQLCATDQQWGWGLGAGG